MSTTDPSQGRVIPRRRVRPGVYERRNRDGSTTFEVAYRDSDGKQRRETVGPRMKEAVARLAQIKADMSRGQRVAPRRHLTVAAAAEAWLAASGHLRDTTHDAYRAALDHQVLPDFGPRRLESITADDLARWIQRAQTLAYRVERDRAAYPDPEDGPPRKRPSEPYSARTIDIALGVLHRVYRHAARRQGYAGTSPVAALERQERPRDGEARQMVVLTPEQVASLIEQARPAYRPVIAFLAATGCRVGEALGLTWADLDLRERTARIAMQANRKGQRVPLKTMNSRRTLDLPGSLAALLAAHKLAADDTSPQAFVFASMGGNPLDGPNVAARGVRAACKAAKVPVVGPHALRHAHASALLADGWDLAAISRRLGHGSVAVTARIYAHLIEDEDRRRERRDRLDALYGGPTVAAAGS